MVVFTFVYWAVIVASAVVVGLFALFFVFWTIGYAYCSGRLAAFAHHFARLKLDVSHKDPV